MYANLLLPSLSQLYNDYLSDPKNPKFSLIPESFATLDRKSTITNKDVEKAFAAYSKDLQQTHLEPGMDTVRRCGNMYTASLYGGLASTLSNISSKDAQGRRILMYSFGSGSAASFFCLKVVGDTDSITKPMDLKKRLADMEVVPVQAYVDALKTREATHNAVDYKPKGDVKDIWPGAYYLENTDHMFRRTYGRIPKA